MRGPRHAASGPPLLSHGGSAEAVRCRPMERAREARERPPLAPISTPREECGQCVRAPSPFQPPKPTPLASIKFPGPLRIGDLRVSRNTPERNFVAARGRAAVPVSCVYLASSNTLPSSLSPSSRQSYPHHPTSLLSFSRAHHCAPPRLGSTRTSFACSKRRVRLAILES